MRAEMSCLRSLIWHVQCYNDHHARNADRPADGCKGIQSTVVIVTPDVGSHTAHLAGGPYPRRISQVQAATGFGVDDRTRGGKAP